MKLPNSLSNEARDEAYAYFDKQIRALPRTLNGSFDEAAKGFHDNDVDAFRHAYVSGVFAQEYGETAADIFGQLNEFFTLDAVSNNLNPRALNMDLWNNSVGRKYGAKAKSREELLKKIHDALRNGELVTDPTDSRTYDGTSKKSFSSSKPVIVIAEGNTGRNELFFDVVKRQALAREEFIAHIQAGHYPGYAIKEINGIPTPVSNPDGLRINNLS